MATKRSTSITAHARNVKNALSEIAPPPEGGKLNAKETALFHVYTQGKATDDWFPHELLHLCQLAKLTHLFNESKAALDKEGSIVYNARGTPVCNPLYTVVDSLIRSQLALTRSLNLSSASGQKKEQNTRRANKQKKTKGTLSSRGSLLAIPTSKTQQ